MRSHIREAYRKSLECMILSRLADLLSGRLEFNALYVHWLQR